MPGPELSQGRRPGSVGVLPSARTEDAFRMVGQDEAALRPGVDRLCHLLGVDASALTRYAAGSRPVYAAGEVVLKLFPPVATWPGYRVEAQVLAAVQGRLPTPAPQVYAAGEHDGWGYVLMSRLSGVPLDAVWDQVPSRERDRLADQLGETIAALHQLPPPAIRDWWPGDWPAFVTRQRARCVGEQLALGLPELWADQLAGFLDEVAPPSGPPVLLHTEIMRQNLLAAQGPAGTWRLSGLIDFEPAMRGEREYEFVAVGVFVAEGDARFLTRTLTAYGYRRDQLGPDLRRRLLAWGILHRYSHLRWWMHRLPEPAGPTLDALADCRFATELTTRPAAKKACLLDTGIIPRVFHVPPSWTTAAACGGLWLHGPETSQGRRSVPELAFAWWQVLGSNQGRVSRRFYRPLLPTPSRSP